MLVVEFNKMAVVGCTLNHLVEELLTAGWSIVIDGCLIRVRVVEFSSFLRAYWRVCSIMSRTGEGCFIALPLIVRVLLGDIWYETKIWCDVDNKCLRYGSVG